MELLIQKRLLKRLITNHRLLLIAKILIILLASQVTSCKLQAESASQNAGLMMEIKPINIVEKNKTIYVMLNLAENTTHVILNQYQLKITVSGNNNDIVLGNDIGEKKENLANTVKNLSFFIKKTRLSTEDEPLIIPFTLIPSHTANNATNISFALLDEYEQLIKISNMTWPPSTESITIPLTSINKENEHILSANRSSLERTHQTATVTQAVYINQTQQHKYETDTMDIEEKGNAMEYGLDTLVPPLKKTKVANGIIVQENKTTLVNWYSRKEIRKLAQRANDNDKDAQEIIVMQCLRNALSPLMMALVNPLSWRGIEEIATRNPSYMYLLLCFLTNSGKKDLNKEIRNSIKADAKAGNPIAQTNLGYIYQIGLGINWNNKKAVKWYTKAVNKGYARSQYHLGDMYYLGESILYAINKEVIRDNQKAALLYEAAANQGDVAAQADLGHMYEHSLGVEQNDQKAAKYYKSAALQGNTVAAYNLGLIYIKGKGVKQNYKKAIKWLKKAAKQENQYAQIELGTIYEKGLATDMNLNEAIKWYTKAANQEILIAQNALARIYKEKEDFANAIFWLMKAKNKKEVQDIIGINRHLRRFTRKRNVDHIETLEHTLIKAWQEMVIEKTYTRKDSHLIAHQEAYMELEEIMGKLISWRYKLSMQAGLMMNCIFFQKSAFVNAIKSNAQKTSTIPYIDEHSWEKENFLSVGNENVQLAQEIIYEAENNILYKKVRMALNKLKKDYIDAYQKICHNITGEALFIEEKLAIYQKSKITKEEEIFEHKNYLNRLNAALTENNSPNIQDNLSDTEKELTKLFKKKIKTIAEQEKMFKKYYTLFLEEIQKGLPYRNNNFQDASENAYLF